MFSSCIGDGPEHLVRTGNMMGNIDVYDASMPGLRRRKDPDKEGEQDA